MMTPDPNLRPPTAGGVVRGMVLAPYLILASMFFGFTAFLGGILKTPPIYRVSVSAWSRGILFISGIRLKLHYAKPLDSSKRYVFVANHQSALDIPILIVSCFATHDVRFMAKESLFKIPFFGWGLSGNGFIPIRRNSARHSAEIFKELTNSKLNIRNSYVIFPEGTRTPDGHMQSFKRGAISLLLRLGFEIVPVTLIDACRANPKGTYRVRAGTIHVMFHEPVAIPDGMHSRTFRDDLLNKLHAKIAEALPEDQKPLEAAAATTAAEE